MQLGILVWEHDVTKIRRFQIMDVNKHSPNLQNEEGQAIFELLVFLPVFLFLFVVIYNIGNSLNISINQQKASRRYFYYLQKGNSFLPRMNILQEWKNRGFKYSGLDMIGYRDYTDGETPVAPCFKFPSFLTGETDETCDEPSEGEGETNFIRIMTVYGICGETFRLSDQGHWLREYSNGEGIQNRRSSSTSCSLTF